MINKNLLNILKCPKSGQKLQIKDGLYFDERLKSAVLTTENGKFTYKVVKYIPRFVSQSNYADNFGKQWNFFKKTQLDSHSGHPISENRFWKSTNWVKKDLKNKWILDVGCGAGRFAEIALNSGAHVVALDYSNAIDACFSNLKKHKNLYPIQGDIYNLPFKDNSFDYIYSLGVLQHTPDVEKAFSMLPRILKNGGKICVDTYWKRLLTMLDVKYAIRPITKRMDSNKLFLLIQNYAKSFLKLNRAVSSIPLFGKYLSRFIPIADYRGKLPLNDEQLLEWAILDTYDMLAPQYDSPQSIKTLEKWFKNYGLVNINVKMDKGLNGPTANGEKPR